jgi:hypothetical protein
MSRSPVPGLWFTNFFVENSSAKRELSAQALEQILIGQMMAIAGEAMQIFRSMTMFEYGIVGKVEFKDNDGRANRVPKQLGNEEENAPSAALFQQHRRGK